MRGGTELRTPTRTLGNQAAWPFHTFAALWLEPLVPPAIAERFLLARPGPVSLWIYLVALFVPLIFFISKSYF